MQRSRLALLSNNLPPIKLRKHITIPPDLADGLVKCRIVYDETIQKITYTKYQAQSIKSLKLVLDDTIDYQYKYLDREHINELFAQRGDCDDIIIVKDGMLTDSSYSNIVLLQNGIWYTPKNCLLNGTRRQQLLDQGRIIEREISADTIDQYSGISLINAMMGLGRLNYSLYNNTLMLHHEA